MPDYDALVMYDGSYFHLVPQTEGVGNLLHDLIPYAERWGPVALEGSRTVDGVSIGEYPDAYRWVDELEKLGLSFREKRSPGQVLGLLADLVD